MKFTLALALSAAAVAYGQSITDLPSCALNCFIGPLQSDGCKSLTDFKCHCSKPDLFPQVVPCVDQKCEPDVAQSVREQAVALCESYGVDITLPGDDGGEDDGGDEEPTTTEVATSTAPTSAPASTKSEYVSISTVTSTSPHPTSNNTVPSITPPSPTNAGTKATFGAAAFAVGVAALAGL